MALRLKTGEIPGNAVILTKSEAIKYQWKQIAEWKPRSEIWPFTYGVGFLGGVAALSGLYINLQFRRSLQLKEFGFIASSVTTTICPAAMTCFMQLKYVTEKVFLPSESCPLCIELRSAVIQNANAIGYPLILVPVTNFMLTLRGQTHRIPRYTNWRELLVFCKNIMKPVFPSLAFIGLANTLAASFIVYKQFNCLFYMRQVLSLNNESNENGGIENNFL